MNQEKSNIEESTFETADGVRLLERRWRIEQPKAILCLVHGFTEHGGRYNRIAEYLNQHGYSVYTFDLRGHGRSDGARALVRSVDEHLSDLGSFFKRVRSRETGKQIFLLGHSMGGTIATLFILSQRTDVNGLILSGPVFRLGDNVSPAALFKPGYNTSPTVLSIVRMIGRLLPRLPTVKIDSGTISRDPEVVRQYEADPLVYHGRTPAGTGAAIIDAIDKIRKQVKDLKVPLLILHGTADQLADVEGSRWLHARAGSPDKMLKLYEEFYHELLNEPEKMYVLDDMVTWMNAHINSDDSKEV